MYSYIFHFILQKSGKWCSMHVQIAWKIHRHQQENGEVSKGGEGKSLDPLQSGRSLSSSNLHRPTDLSMSSSLLGNSLNNCYDVIYINICYYIFDPSIIVRL